MKWVLQAFKVNKQSPPQFSNQPLNWSPCSLTFETKLELACSIPRSLFLHLGIRYSYHPKFIWVRVTSCIYTTLFLRTTLVNPFFTQSELFRPRQHSQASIFIAVTAQIQRYTSSRDLLKEEYLYLCAVNWYRKAGRDRKKKKKKVQHPAGLDPTITTRVLNH